MTGRNLSNRGGLSNTEAQRLRRALADLDVLKEIAAAATVDQPVESILQILVDKCVARFDSEQGALHLFEPEASRSGARTLLRRQASRAGSLPFRLDDQLVGYVLKHRRPLRFHAKEAAGSRPASGLARSGAESILTTPLWLKGEITGFLTLVNKASVEGFSEEDEQVLSIIAAHAAVVIDAARKLGELERDRQSLKQRNADLRREIAGRYSKLGVIGSAPKFLEVFRIIDRVRDARVDVLVTGESGSGKEVVAKALHYAGNRSEAPFVALNCAALPGELLEAELFGIERGVATGVDRRIGQFEAADGGTLFLDEIGDLSLAAQAKILRALQERQIQRVGARDVIPVDVRVVAATNKPLEAEVRAGRFREDLLYRLNVIRIEVPPLRERRQDIAPLAERFAELACSEFGREPVRFTPQALAALSAAPWPGNVRELENEVKRLVLCANGSLVGIEDVAGEGALRTRAEPDQAVRPLDDALHAFERRLLIDALRAHDGNQAATARALGLSRPGLFKKLKRHGVSADDE